MRTDNKLLYLLQQTGRISAETDPKGVSLPTLSGNTPVKPYHIIACDSHNAGRNSKPIPKYGLTMNATATNM